MGIVRQQSIIFTSIYYLGILLGYVNTVLLFPAILDAEQFGLTRVLLSVSIVISQFAQLGTPGMVIRYYPILQKKVFSVGAIICTSGVLFFFILIYSFQDFLKSYFIENSSLFTDYFYLLFPFALAIVYYNLFDAYLRATFRNAVSVLLSNIVLRLLWTVIIVLYSLQVIDFYLFIVLYSCSYALITLISFIYIKITDRPSLITTFNQEEKGFLKQIKSYNFFTLLAGLSSFLINKIDILMLGSMVNLKVLGAYAIASYMGMVIRSPASSIGRTAPSLVAQAFKNNDLKSIRSLYAKSSITQLILSVGIYILILINFQNITFLLEDEYAGSFMIFVFLGLSNVIDSAMGINGFIIVNSKYYKAETMFSVALLILIVTTNLWLIPIYGAIGAAIASLSCIFFYNLLRLIFIWSKYKIQPFSIKTLAGIAISALALFIGYYIPQLDFIIFDAIVRSLVFAVIFVSLTYFLKLSEDINQLIEKLIGFIRK